MAFSFDFSGLLNATADVEQKTVTKDSGGGSTNAWTTRFSSVPVSLQPLSGAKIEQMAQMQVSVDHVAYTDTVYAVQNGDRLVSGGVKYLIQYIESQGGTGEVFAVYCKRITQ